MKNVNTEVYDKRIDRAAMSRLYEERLKQKVDEELKASKSRGLALFETSKNKKTLKLALNRNTDKTFKNIFDISKLNLLGFAGDQLSWTQQTIESAVGKMWRTAQPNRRLAEELVLSTPIYKNKLLKDSWGSVALSEKKRMSQQLRKGFAEGKSISEMAKEIRKGRIHKLTRNQAFAITTTSLTSVATASDFAVYDKNAEILQGWQYHATLDSRTTSICRSEDGNVYPLEDHVHRPPLHIGCRSVTVPVFKSYEDMSKITGVSQIRKRNMAKLSNAERLRYDGMLPMRETYHQWLSRQTSDVQYRHLGSTGKVTLFQMGKLDAKKFITPEGASIGLRDLRKMTDKEYTAPGDTRRFADAKIKLDNLKLWASTPEDFLDSSDLRRDLKQYYLLQAGELDGTLSLTNFRGVTLATKRNTRRRVLDTPPREDQLLFNPITRRYEDARRYQPDPSVLDNNLRLVDESSVLKAADKEFIHTFIRDLRKEMSANEAAAVTDNLRIVFTRFRKNGEVWGNAKAVLQSQIKFDIMNVSDTIETRLRARSDTFKKLTDKSFLDPVLGASQLDDLHDNLLFNIRERNWWEDNTAPKLARELAPIFDTAIPVHIKLRLSGDDMKQFYLRFAHRLSLADTPDKDQFAIALGRDLHNMANLNGDRLAWHKLGSSLLEQQNHLFKLETYGVQKRRMRSRASGQFFGQYYDTFSQNIRVVDDRINNYSVLQRKIDVGMRIPNVSGKSRLLFRKGYKTYFMKTRIGLMEDTRIPITSTRSYSDFPEEFLDQEMVDALNWASQSKYKVDGDMYDFTKKLLYFKDDKGRAKYYDSLNEYRHYMAGRDDTYERLKAMEWLRKGDHSFDNIAFIDHRARIYERGFVGPQGGETYRPFLNTAASKPMKADGFRNLQDTTGAFLGGLDDFFEGRFDSLTFPGRQKIAERWRPELVKVGNLMLRGKPNDLRKILENPIVGRIEGEELGKFFRLALETAKVDNHLSGSYGRASLKRLDEYMTSLALEQDASSSGAQIIALTTRNKKLAQMSNVVSTDQKRRLYDEIAAITYNDPRFRELNQRLHLTEKDLRKAAKMKAMVSFYGAGERTGILTIESKLAKILGKSEGTLVVKASERDAVLGEISAKAAMFKPKTGYPGDPDTYKELMALRKNVKQSFDKGIPVGQDLMEQLWFLDVKSKEFVDSLSSSYSRIVTPDDFRKIAKIMSDHLDEQVPILKIFTRWHGRLAEQFLIHSKPSKANFDWSSIIKEKLVGSREKGYTLSDRLSEFLSVKAGEPVTEKFLRQFSFYDKDSNLWDMLKGVKPSETRRTGAKYLKMEVADLWKLGEIEIFKANKLPKSWTSVPSVNMSGKVVEQVFRQRFEEKLKYFDKDSGKWIVNIVQIPQKTEATWWEQLINKEGKINDIADSMGARTAYGVNKNHSDDATLVKAFHLWGKKNKVDTSTIHDAFFTNVADMSEAKRSLRQLYANAMKHNTIKMTLDEMRARGLPKHVYDAYLNEAIEEGLIPVVGRSRLGGRLMTEEDLLTIQDVMEELQEDWLKRKGWYGIGP